MFVCTILAMSIISTWSKKHQAGGSLQVYISFQNCENQSEFQYFSGSELGLNFAGKILWSSTKLNPNFWTKVSPKFNIIMTQIWVKICGKHWIKIVLKFGSKFVLKFGYFSPNFHQKCITIFDPHVVLKFVLIFKLRFGLIFVLKQLGLTDGQSDSQKRLSRLLYIMVPFSIQFV